MDLRVPDILRPRASHSAKILYIVSKFLLSDGPKSRNLQHHMPQYIRACSRFQQYPIIRPDLSIKRNVGTFIEMSIDIQQYIMHSWSMIIAIALASAPVLGGHLVLRMPTSKNVREEIVGNIFTTQQLDGNEDQCCKSGAISIKTVFS